MFLHILLAATIFSLTVQNGYCQLFSLSNLAITTANVAIQARPGDMNFPIEPLKIKTIQNYVESVRTNLDPYAIHQAIPIYILKTARIQGQSFTDGSEIDITRGMLNIIENEAELACLLGHEIGHSDLHHVFSPKDDGLLNKLVGVGISTAGTATGMDTLASVINDKREIILQANMSQKQEQEADEYGVILAAKAGYNPYALCDLFERIMKKIGNDALYHAGSLTSTHQALDERASHLRKFLKEKGYEPSQEHNEEKSYQLAMTDLKKIRTNEGPQLKQEEDLDRIQNEINKCKSTHNSLKTKDFLKISKELSEFCQKNKISFVQIASNEKNFMAEKVYQDIPYKDEPTNVDYAKRIKGMLAHLVVGAMPFVGNWVGLNEGITGKDFYDGHDLTNTDKTMSTIGGLVIDTRAEQLNNSVELAGETANSISYAKGLSDITKDLSDTISSSTTQSIKQSGKILDSGSNWTRTDDGTAPVQNGTYQMQTNGDQTYYEVKTNDTTYYLNHNPNADDNLGQEVQSVSPVTIPSGSQFQVTQYNGKVIFKR